MLERVLNKKIYNYSFTLAHSPFGPVYLESIKKKIIPNTKDGLFIITIDPWSISSTTENPNDTAHFREKNRCVDNTKKVDMNPNYMYLINNFNSYKYLETFTNSKLFLHDDGWLEANIGMDHSEVKKRTENKISEYLDLLYKYHYSEIRFKYLIKTILYLNQFGKVYLVRLPVHHNIYKIEIQLMNDFDLKLKEAIVESDGYLDLTCYNSQYNYTDGNHLSIESGEKVTMKIAEWILNIQKNGLKKQ